MGKEPRTSTRLSDAQFSSLKATIKKTNQTESAILQTALSEWFQNHPAAESKRASIRDYRAANLDQPAET